MRNRAETGVGLQALHRDYPASGPPGWWMFLPPWPPTGKGRHMGPLVTSADRQLARKRAPLLSS
jgi:hypothetical protein